MMSEKYVLETIIRREDGTYGRMRQYERKKEDFGNGKDVLGGIDWDKTEKMLEPVEDEEMIKVLNQIADKGAEEIDAGDPEFYAAGPARLVEE